MSPLYLSKNNFRDQMKLFEIEIAFTLHQTKRKEKSIFILTTCNVSALKVH